MSKFTSAFTSFAIVAMLIVFACLLPMHAKAQDVANLYMAGGSYSQGGSPAFAGTALYAHQINESGTFAFTLIDALPNSVKPFTVTTNIGAGIAQRVATIGNYPIFVPSAVSISYTGQHTGWAYSTGVGVPILISEKRGVFLMPTLRVLKSSISGGSGYQPIFGLLIGIGK